MADVGAPVIAIALVLAAVFIPVAFLGGLTGALYKQFALTLATSVLLSARVRADVDAGAVRAAAARGPARQAARSGRPFLRSVQPLVRRVQDALLGRGRDV